MQLRFDHIVHYVEEPKEIIDAFHQEGLYAVKGGRHRNRPTYNVLSYFDLSYIEFIGTTDKNKLKGMNHPEHSMIRSIINNDFREGFHRFVLSTNDISKVAKHFKSKGVNVIGPVYLSRERPDGSLLEWELLFVGENNEFLELPYFIQWREKEEDRRRDLMDRKVIVEHQEKTEFSHIGLAVENLEKTISQWRNLLDLPIGDIFIDETIQAKCQELLLPGGNLLFATPNGAGLVQDTINKFGEVPFIVRLESEMDSKKLEIFGGMYDLIKSNK